MLKRLITTCALCFALIGCSNPLPPEKQNYSGQWISQDGQTSLEISQEGRIEYNKVEPNKTTNLSSPIKEFKGDDFSVGLGPLSTDFVVTQPPQQQADGTWTMIVDGQVLIKHE